MEHPIYGTRRGEKTLTTSGADPADFEPDHPANKPFSGIIALLMLVGLVFGGVQLVSGDDAPQPTAAAAAVAPADSSPKPEPKAESKQKKTVGDTSEKNVTPTGRKLPLLPPEDGMCADNTDNWCNRRLGHAAIIVDVGMRETNLPKRAWVVAVATAMQESTLDNLATDRYPVTTNFDYDRKGADHDSVGIMQQRPSKGWGAPEELMNVRIASKKFYDKLEKVTKGWEGWEDPKKVRLTDIAQKVQISGYPEAYQKHEATATKIVNLVLKNRYTAKTPDELTQNKWFVMHQCGDPVSKDCQMVPWALIKPIKHNSAAFSKHFPKAGLNGNIGDRRHQNDPNTGDHTSTNKFCFGGACNLHGWIYAQDFGNGKKGSGFDCNRFTRWLLDELRAHPDRYNEVKYIISTIPENKKVDDGRYYGLFHRRDGWRPTEKHRTDHADHVHISFMPGYEQSKSTIMADYVAYLDGGVNKPVAAPVSGAAAGFPLFTA